MGKYEEEILLDFFKKNSSVKKPLSIKKVKEFLGIKNERQIRRITHNLRNMGEPICYDNEGMYYSEKIEDINFLINKFEAVASSNLKTAEALKNKKTELIARGVTI